jgi:DNA invertase Pin-like site-specific DNA recombinase
MRLAASKGVRLGRPSVTGNAAFRRRWPLVRADIDAGVVSRRKAAKELRIGATTLRRLMSDAPPVRTVP